MRNNIRVKRIRKSKFNPSREDLKNAMDIFLKQGGSIKKVFVTDQLSEFTDSRSADEFLMDGLC